MDAHKNVRIYCGQKVAESARPDVIRAFPFVDPTGTVERTIAPPPPDEDVAAARRRRTKQSAKVAVAAGRKKRVPRKDVIRSYPFVDESGSAEAIVSTRSAEERDREIRSQFEIAVASNQVEDERASESVADCEGSRKKENDRKDRQRLRKENKQPAVNGEIRGVETTAKPVANVHTDSSIVLRLLPASRIAALRTIFVAVKGRGLSSLHLLDTLQNMGLSVNPVLLQECLYSMGIRCPLYHFVDFAAVYTCVSLRSHSGATGSRRVTAHEAMLRDFVGDVSYRNVRAAFKRAVRKQRIASSDDERVPGRVSALRGSVSSSTTRNAKRIPIQVAISLLRDVLPDYVPVVAAHLRKFFYKRRRSSPATGVDFVDVLRAYSNLYRNASRWKEVKQVNRAPVDSYAAAHKIRKSNLHATKKRANEPKQVPLMEMADAILGSLGEKFSSSSSSMSSNRRRAEDGKSDLKKRTQKPSLITSTDIDSMYGNITTAVDDSFASSVKSEATLEVKRPALAWTFDPSGPRDVKVRKPTNDGLFATFDIGSDSFSSMSDAPESSMIANSDIFLENSEWLDQPDGDDDKGVNSGFEEGA